MFPLNPLSLLCGILLCLPLAVIFTLTTPSSPGDGAATCTTTPATLPIITTTKTPDPIFLSPPRNTLVEPKIKKQTTISTAPPPPENEADNQSQLKLPSRVDPNPTPKPTKNQTTANAVTPPPAEDESDDDQSLFKLASRVDPNPNPLKKRKLAFMFLITTSLPFAPLWEIFFSRAAADSYNIYVHAEPHVNATETFVGVFAGRSIKSIPTRRNTPSLAAAGRILLAHALLDDESNSMFAIVSPSCIPLHSFKYTYSFLMKSRKSYVEILENEPNAYKRYTARGEYAMVPEVEYKDFRVGSQWWVLTRNHARIITNDTWIWSKFKLPCFLAHLCYPEEHYFSTLLNLVDPRGCIPCTRTHVDWRFGGDDGHPRTYEPEEVGPGLIRTIRRSRPRYGDEDDGQSNGSNSTVRKRRRHDPFLFARKFAPGALHQLLNMAEEVIFKD